MNLNWFDLLTNVFLWLLPFLSAPCNDIKIGNVLSTFSGMW